MVLLGEKSAPVDLVIIKSYNVSASLFYGFMFYRPCISFAHDEISTSYCIFKWSHETKQTKLHSDSKRKRNADMRELDLLEIKLCVKRASF